MPFSEEVQHNFAGVPRAEEVALYKVCITGELMRQGQEFLFY
jgi:hypothetical protein